MSRSSKRVVVGTLLAFTTLTGVAEDPPTGSELLARSIAHHDPTGSWGRESVALSIDESRPDGSVRPTEVAIDPAAGSFVWKSQRQGHDLTGRVAGDGSCRSTLDGSPEVSEEDAKTYGLTCETLTRRRDYYTYLWGLPMKLRDPGTRVDERIERTRFEGREVLALRVTYDEAVGNDTWYFYFDPSTNALVGYRFYHDESQNDGEYITLDGEERVGGLRLPKTRAWFYNNDDGYLGTDTLLAETGARTLRDGVLISTREPSLAIDPVDDFVFVGRHPFRIRDVAAGERFVFADAEDGAIRRLFIVQFEAFLPGVDEHFRYDLRRSPMVAGYPWRSNAFAFDSSDARRSHPANESSITAAFLEKRGLTPPDQWMMWRSLTVTDPERRSEVILFYVEDVGSVGMTLADLYEGDRESVQWRKLQVDLERRANGSFLLTSLDDNDQPVVSEWAPIPGRAR